LRIEPEKLATNEAARISGGSACWRITGYVSQLPGVQIGDPNLERKRAVDHTAIVIAVKPASIAATTTIPTI
jgi:hypothetical protein